MEKITTKLDEIIDVIKENVKTIASNKNAVIEIKEHLGKNGLYGGHIEKIMSKPEALLEEDVREAILILEQFYIKSKKDIFNPSNWFTDNEIEQARNYDRAVFDNTRSNQIVFEDVSFIEDGVYSTKIDVRRIPIMIDNQELIYDFDIQRVATKRKNAMGAVPSIIKKNVKEMTQKMLKGILKPSTIVFNALVGSSNDGVELEYDAEKRTLTVLKGTELAVLDGWHRCLASIEAVAKSPDIDFHFILTITNFTKVEAKRYQADHAKATPISKTRIEMFESNRLADTVTQHLMQESDLKDRIASKHNLSTSVGELVTYNVLTNAIDKEFNMKTKRDARDVSNYLTLFIEELFGEYGEVFLEDNKEDNLMKHNRIFSGYISLAAKMQEEGIALSKLGEILNKVDFSRKNKIWQEIGLLDSDGRVIRKVNDEKVRQYFKNLI